MDVARDPSFRKKRRIRRIAIGVVLVAGVAIASAKIMHLKPAAPSIDGSAVWPDQVKQGTIERQVHGLGTLVPEEVSSIPAITDGRVVSIPVLPGTPVKANMVLVVLANPTTEKALSDAQAQLKGAEADLAELRATLASQLLDMRGDEAVLEQSYHQAQMLADSDKELLAKGLVARMDADTDASKAEGLKQQVDFDRQRLEAVAAANAAQIASQQAKVDTQESAVTLAQEQLSDLTVRSPFDGMLEDLDMGGGAQLQVGQWVTAGTTVAKVVQPLKLKAEIKIAETDVRDVEPGQSASIDTHNGIVPGHVTRIDPNSQNGTVTVDVALDGPPPPGSRADLSVDGTVNIETLKNVVYVGRPAFGQPDSTVSMFKILPGGKDGVRVQVQLGKASVNTVQILRGLEVGDWVVLSDTSAEDGFDRIRFDPPVAIVAQQAH